jgi:uncharacterized protein
MNVQSINKPPVVGFLHEAEGTARQGLVLTHGAGANCGSALLVNLAAALAGNGWAVLRCDLAFRQKRKFGPPSPAQASADQEGLLAAVRELRSSLGTNVFLGGHSYGGRQASMLSSRHKDEISALLLLSYPLHPPDKPQQLRTAHFGDIHTPCLFVHGTADPLGSPDEMKNAVTDIPVKTRLMFLDGLGHDLGKGKVEIASRIASEFIRFTSK